MLPSILIRDIEAGLRQYLLTAYEPSDDFFRGLMARFLERDGSWMKGPYVQVGLPFTYGARDRDFFEGFATQHRGFRHQEAAWERLKSVGSAANTLVATGTGSGKTECFLYPLLEHCARESAAGNYGIKALILYPMNALATDQARRIAETIHRVAAFKNVRAGLYVGGVTTAGGGTIMTPASVITDRETMRAAPPDILLTNYKMLDYLLIRPKDRELWSKNGPETLRYIVVDELHTFDGAQGTDLALLLRRLKARLKAPPDSIAHIGTSATLGGLLDTQSLRAYAGEVFGSAFEPDSVVTESRLDVGEFLGGEPQTYLLEARQDLGRMLDPAGYRSQEEAVAAWFPVFFAEEAGPADVREPEWRQHLGRLLKHHALFAVLLRAVQGGVTSMEQLHVALARQVAASVRPDLPAAIDALLVLVAWARSHEDPSLPFVTLRIQAWLREIRRMVAPLAADRSEIELKASSDLSGDLKGLHLPLIHCAECHTTAWLSRVATLADNKLSVDLDAIYNTWFGGAAETVRLYPLVAPRESQVEGIVQFACTDCGALNARQEDCTACGGEQLVRVFRTTGQNTVTRRGHTRIYHDRSCPVCGAPDAMVLIGSRSTTLGAQIVDQSWGSHYNDDKKLIAFSDAVQDAAHRAGFIGARTYIHTVRKALARGIDYLVDGSMVWSEFRRRFETLWRDPRGPIAMEPDRFVAEFIGPNMTWQRAWTDLYKEDGHLPSTSPLIDRVQKRLAWQAFAEFTYAGNRGRSLERVGVAALSPAVPDIDCAARSVQQTLRQQFGLEVTQDAVFWWLWGLVIHLRQRGAMSDPLMGTYPQDGNLYRLTKLGGRGEWIPKMGYQASRPVFVCLGTDKDFDPLISGSRKTWYSQWIVASLAHNSVLLPADRLALYEAALSALEAVGVVRTAQNGRIVTVGLNPDGMYLFTTVLRLQTPTGARAIMVPEEAATRLMGMPCLDAFDEHYEVIQRPTSSIGDRLRTSEIKRVIAAEHTGLLERQERESLERRFKASRPEPWYENLLSATPTLEMGVDIGDLSSVMLCSVPPTVASFLQRVGRAGRRDGNAHAATLADGASPHDLYFYEEPAEMMAGEVVPPGVFLQAPEVLRRQYCAFCLDDWVAANSAPDILPEKTRHALDAIDTANLTRFPYTFIAHTEKHRHRLYDAFVGILGEHANEEVRARLLAFVEGADGVDPLRHRVLASLTDIADERKGYARRVKELRASIKQLKSRPQDEATKVEIEGLGREEGKFQELVAEINGRELLETMTDAGLIPNYAFPEAGIELKSVLWRQATREDNTDRKYVTLRALRYERPASSALSEFAPENRFYANQRRVEVDQVNMDLAKLEIWRLCPTCQHMQNLEIEADAHPVCPRCQDAMWGDSAQRRQLLRFRQAIANSNDTNVRIDDSAEEREPKFYVRQMLVDFQASDIREAWKLNSDVLPFGFEFIASAAFRDVNFGELGKPGERFKVAAQDAARPGFRLCRHCGKVQTPPKPSDNEDDESPDHAYDCSARGNPDPANILECLYLYREFHSEALRILVPFTHLGVDDHVIHSFSAAFQLGLKCRFGGQVNHLRVMIQEMPDPEGGPSRCYLLVYDSVPGGTGYLHQLLAHDARTLKEVFQMALAVLQSCGCQQDPEKDGCYRCVYQYRLGRSMQKVSRRIALSVLSDLVGSLDELVRTDTISGIGLNHALESVLERRFIEGLRRLSKVGDLPVVTLIQEIVNGREGYHLQVGDNKYAIELQVDLGQSDGVKKASRPDFVIRPLSSSLKRKPIAVFCDGWTYHKDIVRDDAAKRTAILNSGRHWVWSVVMDDVEAAIQGKEDAVLPSPHQAKTNAPGMTVPPQLKRGEPSSFSRNAVAELLRWLARPCHEEDPWVENAWAASMVWLLRLVPQDPEKSAAVQGVNTDLRSHLPLWLPPVPQGAFDVGLGDNGPFDVRGVWPHQVHEQAMTKERIPNVIWFDDVAAQNDCDRHVEWRWWLWAANWFQAVPGTVLVTRAGLDGGDYDPLSPSAAAATGSATQEGPVEGSAWGDAPGQILGSLVDEARRAASAGCPAPDEVGYILEDDAGEEVSMAELAWLGPKIAVLTAEYMQDRGMWEARGWRVIDAQPQWADQVQAAMLEHGEVNG